MYTTLCSPSEKQHYIHASFKIVTFCTALKSVSISCVYLKVNFAAFVVVVVVVVVVKKRTWVV